MLRWFFRVTGLERWARTCIETAIIHELPEAMVHVEKAAKATVLFALEETLNRVGRDITCERLRHVMKCATDELIRANNFKPMFEQAMERELANAMRRLNIGGVELPELARRAVQQALN